MTESQLKAVKEPRLPPWAEADGWEELVAAAVSVRENAYCPYSQYRVGAALLDERGRIFCGANVENVSFGATICAERSAVCRMVAEGGKAISKIVVATADGGTPCGICLQVLLEFSKAEQEMKVSLVSNGEIKLFSFSDLLPRGFAQF